MNELKVENEQCDVFEVEEVTSSEYLMCVIGDESAQ